jgi:arylsulfatase A-like enzyme
MAVDRRTFFMTSAGAAAPLMRGNDSRPNFIFILTDDHYWQALGANGNPHIHTPHMDRLAQRGILFTNGIISTAQCAPSRGIMLSGLETYQSGLRSNGATRFKPDLGPTAVEQLRRAGYETTLVGKWHINNTPAECGFAKAPLWLRGGSSQYRDPKLRRGLEGNDEAVPGHITDLFTDAGIESVKSAKQPFLLWMAYNAPHSPWYTDAKYRSRYEGKDSAALAPPAHPRGGKPFDWATYYSVITHLDEAIGRLAQGIERAGHWNNTAIFLVGDNGFMCGARGLSGKVVPWDESIRVPFAAAGGLVKGGRRVDIPVASIDVTATWMDLATVRPARPLAGRTLRPLLSGGSAPFDEAYSVWDDGRVEALAVRQAVEPYRLIRTATHKLIWWESGRKALFNLREDPHEQRSLYRAGDRMAGEMMERLRARMKATEDPALSTWS